MSAPATLQCTACCLTYSELSDALTPCPACGGRLERAVDPDPRPRAGKIDLVGVALWQRRLLLLILASVPINVLAIPRFARMVDFPHADDVILVGQLGLMLLSFFVIIRLTSSLGYSPLGAAGLVAAMLFGAAMPLLGMVVLLAINSRATSAIRQSGVRVGLFGADEQAVRIAISPHLCRRCGYDLTGNTSNVCPECAAAVPAAARAVVLPAGPVLPAQQDGLLVTRLEHSLPAACVRCGSAQDLRSRVEKHWWHAWRWYLLVPTVLGYFVAAAIVQRKARIELSVCRRHLAAHRLRKLISWLFLLSAIYVFGYGMWEPDDRPVPVLGGLSAILLGLVVVTRNSRILRAVQIGEQVAWFRGASPAFLARLPEYGMDEPVAESRAVEASAAPVRRV